MPFSIRPFRRFPVQCAVMYNAGPFIKLPLASVALAQAHNLFATLIRQLSPSPYKKRAGSYFCGNGAR